MFDLNRISALLEGLEEEKTQRELGVLVGADLANEERELYGIRNDGTEGLYTVDTGDTELGGLIQFAEERLLQFQSYEPYNCFYGNKKYNPSSYRLEERPDPSTVLAAFHLHATGQEDRLYAAPSEGDMERRMPGSNGVVATFIGTEQEEICVNVDWYNGEEVVDLGNYRTGVELE